MSNEPNEPDRVTLDQLREALTVLGIDSDTKSLREIRVEPGQITVVRHRRNDEGRIFTVAYNDVATVTTTIAVVGK
jgi:hypothetical protein